MAILGNDKYNIGTFCADVTPPAGHSLCGGLVPAAVGVRDPLSARGFIISCREAPIVMVVFDWCELRNSAYHRMRQIIADKIGTSPDRVLVSTVHQHDSPMFDLYAEELLRKRGIMGLLCDPVYFDHTVHRVADAAKDAMHKLIPLTEIRIGEAIVEKVASNRRIPGNGVHLKAWRPSSLPCCSELMDEHEGLIDPYLKLLLLKSGNDIVVALNIYATHPISYYRTGMISADFCGDARRFMEAEHPETLVMYANGCGGNIAPGKYNNGTEVCRQAMSRKLSTAMRAAWNSAKGVSFDSISFRVSSIDFGKYLPECFESRIFEREISRLPACADRAFMERMRNEDPHRYLRYWNAVSGLSWLKNIEEYGPCKITSLEIGNVAFVMLPGEAFIQYQLASQSLRPDAFVMVSAYGDCGMGYIPVDSSWGEGGYEETESYVSCGIESPLINAIAEVLQASAAAYSPTQARLVSQTYKRWPYRKGIIDRILSRAYRVIRQIG